MIHTKLYVRRHHSLSMYIIPHNKRGLVDIVDYTASSVANKNSKEQRCALWMTWAKVPVKIDC